MPPRTVLLSASQDSTTSTTLAPLASRTIRAQAADLLRSSIVQGSLRVGSRIVERRLAEQLGTSLTAVREALVQLESEGLIVKKPNSTTHVVSLTPEEIEQIFAVRVVLECHAFELAAEHIQRDQVQELKARQQAAMQAAKKRQPQEYIQSDLGWHELVWQIPGNPYLYSSIRRLLLPLFTYSALQISEHHDFDLLADCASHAPLNDAVTSGSRRAARKAFLEALDKWREQALVSEQPATATRTKSR